MYVPKSAFGWNRRTGWLHGDEASYNNAVELMKIVQPGRARTHAVHPSWNGYIEHFNPTDPTRSQGAFCRWAKIRPSSLSAAKRKPITDRIELKISEWLEMLWIGDGQGLDGSFNTNQDRVKKEVENG